MANKIRITIGGIKYSVTSDDSEEYLTALSRELELRLDKLARKNPFLSTTMVAVLAALEGYDTAKKAELENEKLRNEVNNLLEQLTIAKRNVKDAKKLVKEVKSNNETQK